VEAQAAPVGAEAHLPRCWRGYSRLEARRGEGIPLRRARIPGRGAEDPGVPLLRTKGRLRRGLVAHSWRGAPWLALSAMGATREEEFRRLEYLGEVVRAALDAAAAEEDLGWILGALDDARRTVEARPAEARAARRNSP